MLGHSERPICLFAQEVTWGGPSGNCPLLPLSQKRQIYDVFIQLCKRDLSQGKDTSYKSKNRSIN